MSKGNIRGITIDFDGNTTKLDKALADVDKQTTNVNKELRQVNDLLKFNPGNADLIAQKQSLLAKQIQNTSDRLGTLKQVQSQVDAQFKSGDLGEEEYRAFQREVVATEGKLKSYQGQLAASKTSQTSLESSTKQLSSYFEASGKSVTDFADVLGPKLTSAIAEGRASSAELNTAINKIGRTVTDNSADFDKFKAALKGIDDGGSIDALKSDLKGLDTQADTTGDALGSISKKLDTSNLMEAADGVSEVGDKLKEVGGQAVNMANGVSDASFKVANGAQTMGLSMKDAESHITAISETGVGSIEDVGDAVSITTNQVQNLNETDLNSLTQSGMNLEQIFGSDMDETMRGVNALMQNYGLTAKQAMDLMVKGTQEGLDKTHELGDNMAEYSQLWSQMGFSAQDTFGILQNGLKSGAYNLDKVNDFVKEFGVSLSDGRIEKNIGKFSKGTQDLFKQYKNGKATASDVFKSLITDLGKSKNKQEALSTDSTIWSSLGEDSAMKVITSLTKTNHAFDDTSGAADKLNQKAKDNNQWQASLTKMENSLTPIGETIKDTLQPFLDIAAKIAKGFASLSEPVRKLIVVIGGIAVAILPIMALFTKIVGIVSSFIGLFAEGGALAGAGGVIAGLAGPIGIAIAAIVAAIVAIIAVIKNWGSIVKWLKGVWSGITGFFSGLWTGIQNVFNTSMTAITTFIKTTWTGISTFFSGLWDGIKNIFNIALNGIVAFVTPIFTSIANVITTIWNGIKTFFTVIWDGIKAVFTVAITAIAVIIGTYIEIWKSVITTAMNLIKTVITTVWNGIKAFFSPILAAIGNVISTAWNAISTTTSNVFNAVKTFLVNVWNGIKATLTPIINGIKNFISGVWNSIRSVTSSVFNAIKSFLSSIWNGIKTLVSSAVNAVKSSVTSVWNGIKSISSSVWNSIKSVISGVWNGIKSAVSSAVNSVKSTVSGVWNGIKSITSSVWNGIKNAITGPMNAAKNVIRGIINAIKGFFNFHISWPHIPMPHFGISPSGWHVGDLLKGSIPHLSVNWNAKGAIFNKPTLFSTPNGYQGVGEAGPEAVAPIDKLMGYVKKAVAEANSGLDTGITVNLTVTGDTVPSPKTLRLIQESVVDGITKANRAHKSAIGMF